MYEVVYYLDRNGKSSVLEYMEELASHTDKTSRIKLQKIYDYIGYLSVGGRQIGEPFVKHLDGEIWELRPIRDRLLFAAWDGECFVLLHHFVKKTRKTPAREIEQARRNFADYRERSKRYE